MKHLAFFLRLQMILIAFETQEKQVREVQEGKKKNPPIEAV
jgi:hypothetical protein